MSEKQNGKSFWTTAPGLLTGLAALITAIGGLITALYAAGLLRTAGSPTVATASPTATVLPPAAILIQSTATQLPPTATLIQPIQPTPTVVTMTPPSTVTVPSISLSTVTPTPQVRYPPVILNEPHDGQSINDFKVVFEWRILQQELASGDSYEVFYRLVASPSWQYKSDHVGSEACSQVLCSKEVRPLEGGCGKYVWTVFVVDRNGTIVSQDGETRMVDFVDPKLC